MVEFKMVKDRFWIAGAVAFLMHSVVVVALAYGDMLFLNGREEGRPPLFPMEVEMVSEQGLRSSSDSLADKQGAKEMTYSLASSNSQKDSLSSPLRVHKKVPSKTMGLSSSQGTACQKASQGGEVPPSVDGNLRPIFNPPPDYPQEARRKKVQGIVLIRLFLNKLGRVDRAMPLPPRMDSLLEEAALKAIRQWRFLPGGGVLEVPVEFKLTDDQG